MRQSNRALVLSVLALVALIAGPALANEAPLATAGLPTVAAAPAEGGCGLNLDALSPLKAEGGLCPAAKSGTPQPDFMASKAQRYCLCGCGARCFEGRRLRQRRPVHHRHHLLLDHSGKVGRVAEGDRGAVVPGFGGKRRVGALGIVQKLIISPRGLQRQTHLPLLFPPHLIP